MFVFHALIETAKKTVPKYDSFSFQSFSARGFPLKQLLTKMRMHKQMSRLTRRCQMYNKHTYGICKKTENLMLCASPNKKTSCGEYATSCCAACVVFVRKYFGKAMGGAVRMCCRRHYYPNNSFHDCAVVVDFHSLAHSWCRVIVRLSCQTRTKLGKCARDTTRDATLWWFNATDIAVGKGTRDCNVASRLWRRPYTHTHTQREGEQK